MDTKEQIMLLAFKLFLNKSYKEVTLKELVEKSGLSKGAFYHYFPSKEKLFIETTERYLLNSFKIEFDKKKYGRASFKAFINEYLSEGQKNVEHIVKNIGGNVKETNFYRYIFQALDHYPGFKKKVEEFHEEEIKFLESLLENAKERKEIKYPIKSYEMAQIIHALLHGISVISDFATKSGETKKFSERMLKNIYRLIEA